MVSQWRSGLRPKLDKIVGISPHFIQVSRAQKMKPSLNRRVAVPVESTLVCIAILFTVSLSVSSAHADNVVATVSVGFSPIGLSYDAGRGEVFVANAGADTVSVISDSSDSVVATIGVGSAPYGVSYDSGNDEIFVANDAADSVSVISDSTNAVVATIGVGNEPYFTAYDAGKSEVFVADTGADTVSVISDSSNSVVATIDVGSKPVGVSYDAGKGEVFVTNANDDSVSVISDSSDSVVATIGVGAAPYGVSYDAGKGEVFVADFQGYAVSVISDSTNTVVATIGVGAAPLSVAYDPAGEVFVANNDDSSVSVISDSTNTVVATIGVGAAPWVAAYDSGRGAVFVSNTSNDSVSVILVTVSAGEITPSSPRLDLDQSVTLDANPSGGAAPYTYQWFTDAACTTPVPGATGSTYSPAPVATGTYYVEVTDSAGTPTSSCSSGDVVTVNPILSAGAITPSSPTIDTGQSVTLTANPSGGSTPYTYQWYTAANCTDLSSGATQSTYSPSPVSNATYSYKITDSSVSPSPVCSSGDEVTVSPLGPSIGFSPSALIPGSQVQVSGSRFAHASVIIISFLDAPIATIPSPCITSSAGNFTCTFTVPASASQNEYTVSATDGIRSASAILFINIPPTVAPAPDNCEDGTPCYTSFVIFSTGQGGVKVSVSSALSPTQVAYTNSEALTTGICAVSSANLSAWGCLTGETGQFVEVVNSTITYTMTYPDGAVLQGTYVVRGAWNVGVVTVADPHSGGTAVTTLIGSSAEDSDGTDVPRAPGPTLVGRHVGG